MHIEIVDGPVSIEYALERLKTTDAGALVVFTGMVRPEEEGRRIDKLHYEHYPELAGKMIHEIVNDAMARHHLTDAVVIHRYGDVRAGEVSVVIAVSSERRVNAFKGCSEIIDRIKQEVPIWKKDVGERTQWQSERK